MIVLASLILATAVSADVPALAVKRVILRAANAQEAKVAKGASGHVIVKGSAQGGAAGYHPSNPIWKETKAGDWGLGFRSKQFVDTLVISTVNEIRYIEHSYYIDGITVTVPANVDVVRVVRRLSSEGAADLTPPVVRAERDVAAVAKGPYQEVHNLWELSPEIANGLQEVIGDQVADAGATWQATDVIGPDPQPPTRRFVIGGQMKNRTIVVYEHGGIARHNHLLAFDLPPNAALRLIGNYDISDKARTLADVQTAMKKPLVPSDHF